MFMGNLTKYVVRNFKKLCFVYVYFDGCLWTRYCVKGNYFGGDISEFLKDKKSSGDILSRHHYFEYIDKFIEDKQFK